MLPLYEPLIERNLEAIPAALRAHRDEHGSLETFKAVGRFAILGYSPSQHGKHAVLACLAAWELRPALAERFDDLVTQLAIYAAEARQPWSEPPILTPPLLDDAQRSDIAELRDAVAAGDRLRGERWLAAAGSLDDLFTVAADDFEDLGHKLIVTDAVARLVPILGEQGRYAALRVGIWEMTAYSGGRYEEHGHALDAETLFARLAEDFIATDGDLEAAHALFLLDAAMGRPVERRVRDYVTTLCRGERSGGAERAGGAQPLPIYHLANDYAEYLKIHALALKRNLPQLIAPAKHNLDRSHFDELSFA